MAGSAHAVRLTPCTRRSRSGTRRSSTHSSLKSRPAFSSSGTATAGTCCRRSGTARGRRARGSGPPSQPWSTAFPSPSSVTCGLRPKPLVSLFRSCCPSGGWCRPAAEDGALGRTCAAFVSARCLLLRGVRGDPLESVPDKLLPVTRALRCRWELLAFSSTSTFGIAVVLGLSCGQ